MAGDMMRVSIDYKKRFRGSNMVEERLKERSGILNISVDELIDRYIRRGLYGDDYYIQQPIPREKLIEMSKREVERDRKRGIPPKKHNFDALIGRWNKD